MQVLLILLLNFYFHAVFLNFFFTGTLVVAGTHSWVRCPNDARLEKHPCQRQFHLLCLSLLPFQLPGLFGAILSLSQNLWCTFLFRHLFSVICSSTDAICFCIDLRMNHGVLLAFRWWLLLSAGDLPGVFDGNILKSAFSKSFRPSIKPLIR